MVDVMADAQRPTGKTSLQLHCGSPGADTPYTFSNVTMVRVWEDGQLAAFDATGAAIIYLRPGSYWGFLWT